MKYHLDFYGSARLDMEEHERNMTRQFELI